MQPVQLKMARAALDWSIDQLAEKAGLPAADVSRVERGGDPGSPAADRLRAALQAAGIEWIGDDGVRYAGSGDGASITVDDLTTDNDAGAS